MRWFAAVSAVVAVLVAAVAVVGLIADWGTASANHRARTIRRALLGVATVVVVVAVISVVTEGLPVM